MRVLVAGASVQPNCGVGDYARTIEPALRAAGAEIETVWTDDPARLRALLETAIAESAPDRILWHYSVYTYGRRGIPTLVPGMASVLRRTPVPAVVLCHELARPARGRRARGAAQALTQHAALVPLLRAASALVVTAEDRVAWLRRPWLPRRPVHFVPIPSNVPPRPGSPAPAAQGNGVLQVGVFGFRHAELQVEAAVDAVARLSRPARLVLVGEPGPESEPARRWREAADRRDVELRFTGVLPLEEVGTALAGLDIVLSPDPAGPAPRRGTLVAALAHGRPVLALDGPGTWRPLVAEQALAVAPPAGLAERLDELAARPEETAAYALRAQAFYRRYLAPDVVAGALLRVLETAGG